MTPEQLIENFSAITEAPDGLLRLRELVLSRAIRGSLVKRQSEDGVAEEQVGALRKALAARVADNVVRKNKPPGRTYDELRWPIPAHWVWARLNELGVIGPRNDLADTTEASFVPMLTVPEGFSGSISGTEDRSWKSIKKQYTHLADGDVALAKITPCFQNRKSVVVSGLTGGFGAGTTELHVFRAADGSLLDPRFILIWLKSPEFVERGVGFMTGTAGQQRVPGEYFSASPFPFPALAEQTRIVAKVDQLMTMLDDFEHRQEKKRSAAVHVSKALRDSLVRAEDAEELARAWNRLSENFGVLTDDAHVADRLRATLLDLGVRGRLSQRSNTAIPAVVLHGSIQRRREALHAMCKADRPRPCTPVGTKETPYALPPGWIWARIDDLCIYIVDCLHKTPVHVDGGAFPSIRTADIVPGQLLVERALRVGAETYRERVSRLEPLAGDVIYAREGGRYGVAATIPPGTPLCLGQRTMLFRLAPGVDPHYFMWALNSSTVFDQARASVGGSASPHVNIRTIRRFVLPLPPTTEQQEIVVKLRRLFSLVGHLERLAVLRRAAASALFRGIVPRAARHRLDLGHGELPAAEAELGGPTPQAAAAARAS